MEERRAGIVEGTTMENGCNKVIWDTIRTEKTCGKCGILKPLEEFQFKNKAIGRRHSTCKPCHIIVNKKYRNPEVSRRHRLSSRYRLTEIEYDAMLEKQEGVCAICSRAPGEGKFLTVDHCHTTSTAKDVKVRGLLCGTCNSAIGLLGDDWMILRRAADYLLDADSLVIE